MYGVCKHLNKNGSLVHLEENVLCLYPYKELLLYFGEEDIKMKRNKKMQILYFITPCINMEYMTM